MLVAHDGRLLAERYADGFDHTTPLPGCSMAKTGDERPGRDPRRPEAEAGSVFEYSSGTANIVARIVHDQFAYPHAQQRFFAEALLEPLGLRSAVLELDPNGTFVGSSFALMSARDWARLGQLYLDDGV